MYLAHVIARQGNTFIVEDKHGKQHICHARSKSVDAVCGDKVECEHKDQSKDVIKKICSRKNQITRIDNFKREKTIAANIDHIIIVVAATPIFSTSLIDKYLACAQLNNCKATLTINKAEILNDNNVNISELENLYKEIVDNFIITSAKLGYGIQTLRQALSNETSILVGQSGVGKSSLINRLLSNNNIKIGELSENIQQGKHTTTNAFAHNINDNGKLIDSPGVRMFMPIFKNLKEVMLGYSEFLPHIGKCKFTDCQHIKEPNCAIKAAVEKNTIHRDRYNSYLENIQEVKNT
ncbi:MAG: ribosome small subunit-dependent GTPase A [Gammaproteobacteria bacterium]|nr:ribosome small subunit-dependent GTPase A [Gammaproteobacteria bacterium]